MTGTKALATGTLATGALGAEPLGSDVAAASDHPSAATPAHTHTKCLNCGTRLNGRYCHHCGQSSDDHHRSILHLAWEAIEGFTHLDGRLANTLPALLFRPGQLARDHIEGRRMRHVPPFRMFLISLLIFMFAAEWAVSGDRHATVGPAAAAAPRAGPRAYQFGDTKVVVVNKVSDLDEVARETGSEATPLARWFRSHVGRAIQNREFYLMLVFEWAHRLAVLMLPILAGLLTLSYVGQRKFYVYDHLVVAMQYLSFCFLLAATISIAPSWLSAVLIWPALIWGPFNLYLILRGAYGSSRTGAVVKAVMLWAATVITFGCLLVALLMATLNQM